MTNIRTHPTVIVDGTGTYVFERESGMRVRRPFQFLNSVHYRIYRIPVPGKKSRRTAACLANWESSSRAAACRLSFPMLLACCAGVALSACASQANQSSPFLWQNNPPQPSFSTPEATTPVMDPTGEATPQDGWGLHSGARGQTAPPASETYIYRGVQSPSTSLARIQM